ncbi:MAG: metal ABC transporter permease [Candidatus Omnitrophota bacterium]
MAVIDAWHSLMHMIPFSWTKYTFMNNSLLAVLLITPLFALLGTMVVSNRMVFFTEVLGHSALTGIAIGVILGFYEPTLPMVVLAIILAAAINMVKNIIKSSMDTVLGVFFAFIVSLGIVILSRQGGFVKYTNYLIGDVLAVSQNDLIWLAGIFIFVVIYWYIVSNALILTSINTSLARSRLINTSFVELSFSIVLAVVVMMSIRLVGILIVNSLLVLPAASSRNFAKNIHMYTLWAVIISIFSGVTGLILSYYWLAASGATIVLVASICFILSILSAKFVHKY